MHLADLADLEISRDELGGFIEGLLEGYVVHTSEMMKPLTISPHTSPKRQDTECPFPLRGGQNDAVTGLKRSVRQFVAHRENW